MNNADVVVGWAGLSLALVVGYGAYKNKPVFGPKGVVTTAIQTGKVGKQVSTGPLSKTSSPSEPPTAQQPRAILASAYFPPHMGGISPQNAPSPPANPLKSIIPAPVESLLKDVTSTLGSLLGFS